MNLKPVNQNFENIRQIGGTSILPKPVLSSPIPEDKISINPSEKSESSLQSINPANFKRPPEITETKETSKTDQLKEASEKPDTFVFVLNSSGETNCAKPLIAAVKNKGYRVKVIHFRQNSKEILTSQGILKEEDFIDGTNIAHLPRMNSVFGNEIDPSKVVKLVGTPHHAFCRFAFSKAKKENISTVALVDMGVPGTGFGFRHTFYKTLTMADQIIVPNETIKKQLEARCSEVEQKSGFHIDTQKVALGGNPGFEAFKQLVQLNRAKADEIRSELNIGKDDIVLSFSSQPTPQNGKVLEIFSESLKNLSAKYPGKKIHALMCPHPRDLYSVGLKNMFGTESSISISQKTELLKSKLTDDSNVVIHEMPKYTMEKASAISHIVLTESSTTAYECAHSDISAIFVRTPQQGKGGAFPPFNRIPTSQTPEDLANLIDNTLQNPPKGLSEDLAKVVTSDMKPYLDVLLNGVGE